MQTHPRLQAILSNFWRSFRGWIERLFSLVVEMDIEESELCVTAAGLHDIWDVVGFFSIFIAEVTRFPQKVRELENSSHHALQIRLWIKIRGCSRPRREAEEMIGEVLDCLMPILERSQRNDLYSDATASFSPEFMLHCLHRTISRIQSPEYGKSKWAGGDDWASCLTFTGTVTTQSDEVFLLYNANRCLFWEITAFRYQVAGSSEIHGSAAYYNFWPLVVQGILRIFNDSPLWMPQAIDAGFLDFFYRSRIHLQVIEETSPPPLTPGATTHGMMTKVLDELSAGLIHRSVLRKTRGAMRYLRKKHGDTAVDEAFASFPRLQRSWKYLIQRLSDFENFRNVLKDIGEDITDCANPSCESTEACLLRCGGCQQVFYCSSSCRKIAWQDHRLQCKEDTALRAKGDVRRLDDRSKAFAVEYAEHLLTRVDEYQDKWEEAIEIYTSTGIPRHLLVADFDFTKKPFTLCAGNGMSTLYRDNEDWETEVQAASEEDCQLVHITIPFVVHRPSRILVALDIGHGSTGSKHSDSPTKRPRLGL
ncbi:hypothetical protein CYLTODRAFT_441923 [Cylindrobasidium torrendii FP15055 ss-10]|uniref:MYND-type domain-containing protein n=1 Tax=Cylindrobasidium torrendii FP15055 ss-10 TaxID=1314674 RepID=A0A0D7BK37_9AGAR|nr:hypothetical protein CYLTODRAFT_441923 [Cylindrobasidium torrendii FP15055 ss-10]